MKAKLYLFPVPLGEESAKQSVPPHNLDIVQEVEYIIAENAKTARKWLKLMGCTKPLQEFEYAEMNEHSRDKEFSEVVKPLVEGKTTAYLSEAGCPGIADPGAGLVSFCHAKGIQVIPLIGPSSILMALMGSGLNGQNFCFNGYLPREKNNRIKRLHELEKNISRNGQTQIFIETPYRNNALLEDMLTQLHPDTKLCIASNLTLPSQKITTRTIAQWKKSPLSLEKIPAVFLLG